MDSNFPLNFEEFSSVWPQYCFLDFADHLTSSFKSFSLFIFYLKLCSVDLSLFILLISKHLILSPVTGELSK